MRVMSRAGRNAGVTLAEMLVVLVIGSLAFTLIASAYREIATRQRRMEARHEVIRQACTALESFRKDAASARAVLDAEPAHVRLWAQDADNDGTADKDELIEYRLVDGNASRIEPSAKWTRSDSVSEQVFVTASRLRIGVDAAPPETRHIVVQLSLAADERDVELGMSVALRRPPSAY